MDEQLSVQSKIPRSAPSNAPPEPNVRSRLPRWSRLVNTSPQTSSKRLNMAKQVAPRSASSVSLNKPLPSAPIARLVSPASPPKATLTLVDASVNSPELFNPTGGVLRWPAIPPHRQSEQTDSTKSEPIAQATTPEPTTDLFPTTARASSVLSARNPFANKIASTPGNPRGSPEPMQNPFLSGPEQKRAGFIAPAVTSSASCPVFSNLPPNKPAEVTESPGSPGEPLGEHSAADDGITALPPKIATHGKGRSKLSDEYAPSEPGVRTRHISTTSTEPGYGATLTISDEADVLLSCDKPSDAKIAQRGPRDGCRSAQGLTQLTEVRSKHSRELRVVVSEENFSPSMGTISELSQQGWALDDGEKSVSGKAGRARPRSMSLFNKGFGVKGSSARRGKNIDDGLLAPPMEDPEKDMGRRSAKQSLRHLFQKHGGQSEKSQDPKAAEDSTEESLIPAPKGSRSLFSRLKSSARGRMAKRPSSAALRPPVVEPEPSTTPSVPKAEEAHDAGSLPMSVAAEIIRRVEQAEARILRAEQLLDEAKLRAEQLLADAKGELAIARGDFDAVKNAVGEMVNFVVVGDIQAFGDSIETAQ